MLLWRISLGRPFSSLFWPLEDAIAKSIVFFGLPSAVVFSPAFDWVTLVELPGLLAKNQVPTGSSTLLMIPAVMTYEDTFDRDHSLCPVWSLHLYLCLRFPRVLVMFVFVPGSCSDQRDPC